MRWYLLTPLERETLQAYVEGRPHSQIIRRILTEARKSRKRIGEDVELLDRALAIPRKAGRRPKAVVSSQPKGNLSAEV